MLTKLKMDLLKARKDKDELKTSVLSFLISAINNKEIELRGSGETFGDEHVEKVIKKQIKNRGQSIEAYTAAGRMELVAKEETEKKVLEEVLNAYFPQSESANGQA